MKFRLSIQFVAVLMLFSYVKSNPVETEEGSTKFNELADLNNVQKKTVDIDNSPETIYEPHRDGDEAVFPINMNNLPNLKYDVELLESEDLRKNSDEIEEHFRGAALHLDTDLFTDEDIEMHKINDPRPISYMALMSAFTIFVLIALILYAVLMTWRQKIEQRYGQRVLLVTRCDDDEYVQHSNSADGNSRHYPLTTV